MTVSGVVIEFAMTLQETILQNADFCVFIKPEDQQRYKLQPGLDLV